MNSQLFFHRAVTHSCFVRVQAEGPEHGAARCGAVVRPATHIADWARPVSVVFPLRVAKAAGPPHLTSIPAHRVGPATPASDPQPAPASTSPRSSGTVFSCLFCLTLRDAEAALGLRPPRCNGPIAGPPAPHLTFSPGGNQLLPSLSIPQTSPVETLVFFLSRPRQALGGRA